jgi:hypothetical protein
MHEKKTVFQIIANSDLVRCHCIVSIGWGEGGRLKVQHEVGKMLRGGASLSLSVSSALTRFGT